LAIAGYGCSLVVNRADSQCSTSADCKKFGAGLACVSGGCVGDRDAGLDTGPVVDANHPPVTLCTSTQDCLPEHQGANWICRKKDSQCVSVPSQDCGTIVGKYTSDDVVLIGALLPLFGPHATTGAALQNAIRMAVTDFTAGFPALADAGPRRPLAVVFCNESDDPSRAARHLRDDLHVPIILGTAFSQSTVQIAVDVTKAGGQLVVSPSASADLSSVNGEGLVWRTVPSDTLQAATMAFTMEQVIEPKVKAPPWPAGTKMRVAIIHKTDNYGTELHDALLAKLKLNGAAPGDAANSGFFIDTDYGNPDDPHVANPDQKFSNAISAVTQVASLPDVIILIGHTQLVQNVMAGIESNWPASASRRPRYLLSNGLQVKELLGYIDTNEELRKRIIGTSPGADPNTNTNLSKFLVRYRTTYKDGSVGETFGTSSAYDAAYVAAFGLAATRNGDLVGSDVVAGQRRILTVNNNVPVDFNADGVKVGLDAIEAGKTIAFRGTSGPLAFDTQTGDVTSDVQVWCIIRNPVNQSLQYQPSGYFYSASLSQMQGTVAAACQN
jgi:ABC-type branched-subunit amino acid transport system substrate-binding protein